MKRRTLMLGALAALAVTSAALFGCGKTEVSKTGGTSGESSAPAAGGKAEDVTLKVWVPENQIQSGTIESMEKSFQALHPEWNITFQTEAQGEDTAKDEILKDIGQAGDVFFFANDQVNELADAGALARLGGSTEEMVKATMEPEVVQTVTTKDGLYGIPFTHNTFFMFYDKTLLDENDVKSIESIMAKQTADNVYNFVFDSAGGWKLGAWYYGPGLSVYGKDGTDFAAGCDWNNSTGLAVTNYLIDLINNPKCAFNDDVSLSELTADHRVGAWFDGAWNHNLYSDAIGEENLGMAKIPTFNPDGKDYQLKGFYGSKAIGVNTQAKNPAVAVAFAAYLGSEEMQIQRFKETGQVPTNLNAGKSSEVQTDPLAKVIVEEVSAASTMQPFSSEFGSRYWSNVAGIATEIRSGELNKENAQSKLDTFVSTLEVK
jgi:arabinogalactan oligomer/maltooligosaccharide transport system substrate-binding protein